MTKLLIVGSVLKLLLIIWFCIAIALFLNFMITGCNITFTNLETNEKKRLYGKQKVLVCLGMSLIWPVIVIKNLFEGV